MDLFEAIDAYLGARASGLYTAYDDQDEPIGHPHMERLWLDVELAHGEEKARRRDVELSKT